MADNAAPAADPDPPQEDQGGPTPEQQLAKLAALPASRKSIIIAQEAGVVSRLKGKFAAAAAANEAQKRKPVPIFKRDTASSNVMAKADGDAKEAPKVGFSTAEAASPVLKSRSGEKSEELSSPSAQEDLRSSAGVSSIVSSPSDSSVVKSLEIDGPRRSEPTSPVQDDKKTGKSPKRSLFRKESNSLTKNSANDALQSVAEDDTVPTLEKQASSSSSKDFSKSVSKRRSMFTLTKDKVPEKEKTDTVGRTSIFSRLVAPRSSMSKKDELTVDYKGEDSKEEDSDQKEPEEATLVYNAPVFLEDQMPIIQIDWKLQQELEQNPMSPKQKKEVRNSIDNSEDDLSAYESNVDEPDTPEKNRSRSSTFSKQKGSRGRSEDLPTLSEILSTDSDVKEEKILSPEEKRKMSKNKSNSHDLEVHKAPPRLRTRRQGIAGIDAGNSMSSGNASAELIRLGTYVPSAVIWHCIRKVINSVKAAYPALSEQIEDDWKNIKSINVDTFIKKWATQAPEPKEDVLTASIEEFPNSCLLIADVSGFTKLNETFAAQGQGGVEQVSTHLNAFLSSLLEVIRSHGGDCVKFAGDALIVLFQNDEWSADNCALRTVQCALELQNRVGVYVTGNVELTLHVGVASGKMFALYVGGVNNEWEFLIAGSCFAQIQSTVELSKSGEVVISKECYELVKHAVKDEEAKNAKNGERLIKEVTSEFQVAPQRAVEYYIPESIKPLLKCFVPRPVLDKLDAGQAQFLAEHRRASVIFVNLRGLILNQDEIQDVSLANKALRSMEVVLSRNKGYRRQFLVDDKGSTFIAVFGVPPYAHEDDAYRAVKTSIELRTELTALGLSHSIGIATGQVYIGSVGKDSFRKEHAVVGDTVNTAARLSGKSQPGQILCDSSTFDYASLRCGMKSWGEIKVKGKDKHVKIYEPISLNKFEIESDDLILLGRESECVTFMQHMSEVKAKAKVKIVWVEGPPGIGKSHLIQKFRSLARKNGFTTVHVSAEPTESNTPMYMVKLLVKRLLGVEELLREGHISDQTALEISQKLPSSLRGRAYLFQELLCSKGTLEEKYEEEKQRESEKNKVKKRTASLTRRKREHFTAAQLQQRLEMMIIRLLKSMAGSAPMAFFIDDMQMVDSASIAMFKTICTKIKNVMFVVTSRPLVPEEHESFELHQFVEFVLVDYVVKLELRGLTSDQIEALTKVRLDVNHIPQPVLTEIIDRSKGNPLFAIEIAYALRETGIFNVSESESFAIKRGLMRAESANPFLSTMQLPQSLAKLVTRRLDNLPASEQLVCKLASLFGKEFPRDLLGTIYVQECENPTNLDILLATLKHKDIIEMRTSDAASPTFFFKNMQFQQACYDMLLFSQKARLHKQIGEYYEAKFDAKDGSYSELASKAAFHYHKAVKSGDQSLKTVVKALKFLLIAARESFNVASFDDAIVHASKGAKAADLIPIAETEVDKDVVIEGKSYKFELFLIMLQCMDFKMQRNENVKVYGKFEEIAGNCLEFAKQYRADLPNFVENEAFALVKLWKYLLLCGRFEDSVDVTDLLISTASEKGNKPLLIESQRMRLWSYAVIGRFKEICTLAAEALENIRVLDTESAYVPLNCRTDILCISMLGQFFTGDRDAFSSTIVKCETFPQLLPQDRSMYCRFTLCFWMTLILVFSKESQSVAPMVSKWLSMTIADSASMSGEEKAVKTLQLYAKFRSAEYSGTRVKGHVWALMNKFLIAEEHRISRDTSALDEFLKSEDDHGSSIFSLYLRLLRIQVGGLKIDRCESVDEACEVISSLSSTAAEASEMFDKEGWGGLKELLKIEICIVISKWRRFCMETSLAQLPKDRVLVELLGMDPETKNAPLMMQVQMMLDNAKKQLKQSLRL